MYKRDCGDWSSDVCSSDLVAALSVVNVVLVAVGLGAALRLGVRLHG
jgi:hypothetical protein